ncbi:MAG: hypothetical protein ACI9Q3_000496 [Maribacter sp.]|jgi:hypothetical protein
MDEELRQIPLFLKAEEIFILVNEISILIKGNSDKEDPLNKVIMDYKKTLDISARRIPGYIANVYKVNIYYHVRMHNAVFIRSDANAILASIVGLEVCGFKELDYLELIKKEIEEFRILFVEWVQTFNIQLYVIDRWGLFNPPGINHDDFDINILKGEGCYSPFDDFDFENINLEDDEDEDDEDDDEDEDEQSPFDSLFGDKD